MLHAQVMKVVFGQDLADESAGVAQQVFSVSVAIGGLAAFALVLALIEQVVLQVRGSSLLCHSSCVRQSSNASSGLGFLCKCSCESRMHDLLSAEGLVSLALMAFIALSANSPPRPACVVLQVLDDNVKRGSRVFESNHVRTAAPAPGLAQYSAYACADLGTSSGCMHPRCC